MGLAEETQANPIQAALASAAGFSVVALAPALVAVFSPARIVVLAIALATLFLLAGLGALGGWLGGSPMLKPALRVMFAAASPSLRSRSP